VLITAGKDKSKQGKILSVLDRKIVVEGINLRKKHVKPKKQGEKGQIVQITAPLDASNVMILCPKCGKKARIGYTFEEEKKQRICKQCNQVI